MTDAAEPVRDLARSLPASELPAYIYDLAALGEHARGIRRALPEQVEVYYAVKANPDPRVLTTLAPHLDGFEISSGGELAHLARTLPGRRLAFGGPGKTPDEIAAALRGGVGTFHVESAHDLEVLAHQAAATAVEPGRGPGREPVRVLLRVNLPWPPRLAPAGNLAMGGVPSPFGLDPDDVDLIVARVVQSPHLELAGVHTHLASGLTAPEHLVLARSAVEWAVKLFVQHGVALREVNLGGGMLVDYQHPDSRFDWPGYGAGLARLAAEHPGVRLRLEPGRAMTAYCGWYATEVLDIKTSHGRQFAVVRGGTHHLRTPAAKGHDQPCGVLPVEDWAHPWPRAEGDRRPVTLVGQLCTPKDVLARAVDAPGLRAGDRVLFGLAGAYAWNISHRDFLMHDPPSMHYV